MQDNRARSWSEMFAEIVDVWCGTRCRRARWDWPWHRERLGWWRRQVDAARERNQQGHREALRVLYDRWRIIAEDVEEQARFAAETYRQPIFLIVFEAAF